jgi:hypothetical protein
MNGRRCVIMSKMIKISNANKRLLDILRTKKDGITVTMTYNEALNEMWNHRNEAIQTLNQVKVLVKQELTTLEEDLIHSFERRNIKVEKIAVTKGATEYHIKVKRSNAEKRASSS